MSVSLEQKFHNLNERTIRDAEINQSKMLILQKKHNMYRLLQISLTTITTVLLGLKLTGIWSNLAFICSATVTALSAWYNFDESKKVLGVMNEFNIIRRVSN